VCKIKGEGVRAYNVMKYHVMKSNQIIKNTITYMDNKYKIMKIVYSRIMQYG